MADGYAPNDPRKPKSKRSSFVLDDFGESVGDGTVGSGVNSGENPNFDPDTYVPTVPRDWDA